MYVSPLTPVFQTTLVYLRPETMLLETVKENFRRYWLPSLRVKILFLESVVNGIGRMRSGLPGHIMVRLTIFTSGSIFSGLLQQQKDFNNFSGLKKLNNELNGT